MYFEQAGDRYEKMGRKEREHLIDNIAQSLMFVDENIQKKAVEHLKKADLEMGERVERELFLEL